MNSKFKAHAICTCGDKAHALTLKSDILPAPIELLNAPKSLRTGQPSPSDPLNKSASVTMLEIETELHLGPLWLCDSCWDRNREGILDDVLAAFKQLMPKELGFCRNVAVHPELHAKRDFLRNVVTILVAFGMTPDGALTLSEAPRIADLVRTPIRSIEFREADWRNYEPGQVFLPQITAVDILSVKTFSSLPKWYANLSPASSAG